MIFYHIILGCLAFVLYLLYDINSILWQNRWGKKLFFLGSFLLVGTSCALVYDAWQSIVSFSFGQSIALLFAVLFFILLIYTLFFALPFTDTYRPNESPAKPSVCQRGVYALCRHPGVLWFIGFYFCLWLAFKSISLFWAAVVFSLLNFLYIVFQDRWTFISLFDDYPSYQATTPFLLPTWQSIRRCFSTLS